MSKHTTADNQPSDSANEYRSIVQAAVDGFWRVDLSGRILEVNASYCEMTGYREDELLAMTASDIDTLESPAETIARIEELKAIGYLRFESRHRRKDGSTIDVEVSAKYHPYRGGQLISFIRDITRQKTRDAIAAARARLQKCALTQTLKDLLRATLDEAEQLTNSTIGFYHFVEADQETLTLQQWSTNTVASMCTAEGAGRHYPISEAGVWCDCVAQRRPVVHNDYASLPHRKGLPDGHAPVLRELIVPVLRRNQIVAILGVGNKATDYDAADVEAVEMLADLAWDVAEIKLSAEQHHDAAERFGQLMENAEVWVWEVDAAGLYTYSNPVVTNLLGYTPDELVGKLHFYDLFTPAQQRELKGPALAAFSAAEPIRELRNVNVHKSGHEVVLETNGVPILDPLGVLQGYRGADIDVTARARAEQALRESEAHHRNLIEHLPGIVYAYSDVRGGIYYSPKVTEILGYTPEELYAQPLLWNDSIHPEYQHAVEENVRNSFTGTKFCLEYRIRDLHGNWRWFEDRATECVALGDEAIIQGFALDITERKQAEIELQESRMMWTAALSAMTDAVFLTDKHGNITDFNQAFVSYHRFPDRNACISVVSDFWKSFEKTKLNGDIVPPHLWSTPRALGGETVISEECCLRRKDTGEFWFGSYSASPILDADGEISGAVVVIRDITERIRAEEALRLQSLVLDQIQDTVTVTDIEGRIQYVNNAQCYAVKRSRAELIGQPVSILGANPHRGATQNEVLENTLAHGAWRGEIVNIGADGREFTVDCRTQLIRDSQGRIVALSGIGTDISEQKRVNDLNRRLAAIVEFTDDAIIGKDLDGVITTWNLGAERMYGYTAAEILGRSVTELTPPDYHDEPRQFMEIIRNHGHVQHFETQRLRKDGTLLDVSLTVSGVYDENGAVIGASTIARDVSDRKKTERAMRESETRFRTLFEKAGLGVAVIDLPTRSFVQINQKYCDLLGYAPSEMLGKNMESITHPNDVAASIQQLARLVAREIQQYTMEKRYIAKNGDVVWVTITVSMLSDSPESGRYHMVIAEDISRRKLAEEEKARLEEQLRQSQKMEAVGQLAGGIAHDFNNLLLIITGYTAMIMERLPSASEDRADLEEVHKAAERAASLTRQLLTFSRRQIVQPVQLDLNQLIEDDLKMIRRIIGEHIDLRYLPGTPPAVIVADRGQLDQIVMNLCVNARDAMDSGGTLTIRTDNVVLDDRYCERNSWAHPGSYALLELTDTGSGMDERTLAHIFEPFFTTKDVGQGTGLGLSTVYGIVRQNDGLIHVDSEPGRGSVFRIYFPRLALPDDVQTPAVEEKIKTGAETILIAEDEESVRKLLCRILESAGYTVLTAVDGQDALDVFERHQNEIALAILDVMMPKLGGRQVMDQIKARSPRTRFLFASGYARDAIHTDFVVDEDIRLVPKPYQKAALLRAIRDELDAPDES